MDPLAQRSTVGYRSDHPSRVVGGRCREEPDADRRGTGQSMSAPATLQHDALFYTDATSYRAGLLEFVRTGLERDEPVLVAVPQPGLGLFQSALDADETAHVRTADMAVAGRNPGRIIGSVLTAFVREHGGRRVRIVGEPIWAGRTPDEYPACAEHEALINVALRDAPAYVLCPYDVTRLDRAVLTDPSAADLRLVAVCATGVDRVDLDAARERGLCVTNVRSWCDESVAEHVVALMLALRRDLVGYHGAVVDGSWSRAPGYSLLRQPLPLEVRGQVMGIIGFGSIGAAVARLAGALGMEVLVAERRGSPPRPGRVPLEELLARSDVVSLHCPLTPETAGLIGAAELALMRPHALLINCARGGIVDEAALADALKTGRIGGAGLDCLAHEPPPDGAPLLAADLPNLIVTPHMSWASQQSLRTIADQLIETIESFVAGRPRNVVVGPGPD
jgi:glycerate dehydrogenase